MNSLYAQTAGGERLTGYVDESGKRKKGKSVWARQADDLRAAYQAERDYNARALAAAQEQARSDTAAQIDAMNKQVQGTQRQLYRDYMQQQRTMPEQLAARGYTGGLTESSMLRLGTAYGEALNSSEEARLSQQADYSRALSRQLYEAQAAAAQADEQAMQRYYDERRALEARRMSALEKRAAALAAQGDFRLYRQLGYTDREIRYLERMYRKQHPELFRSGKSSGGRSRRNGTETTYTGGTSHLAYEGGALRRETR